jgi:hypothetical protein
MVTNDPFSARRAVRHTRRDTYIRTEISDPFLNPAARGTISTSTSTTMARHNDILVRSNACRNCGHRHTQLANPHSANCFFITIRRSGRDPLALAAPHSVSIPSPTRSTSGKQPSHHRLRDFIWEEFSNLKAEVDMDRDAMIVGSRQSPNAKSKGQLRVKAPIPWLSWTAPDGQHGQTRNKANFFALWDRVVREAAGGPAALDDRVWVSSVLLPARPQGLVFEDMDDACNHGYEDLLVGGEKTASGGLACSSGRWDAGPIVVIS